MAGPIDYMDFEAIIGSHEYPDGYLANDSHLLTGVSYNWEEYGRVLSNTPMELTGLEYDYTTERYGLSIASDEVQTLYRAPDLESNYDSTVWHDLEDEPDVLPLDIEREFANIKYEPSNLVLADAGNILGNRLLRSHYQGECHLGDPSEPWTTYTSREGADLHLPDIKSFGPTIVVGRERANPTSLYYSAQSGADSVFHSAFSGIGDLRSVDAKVGTEYTQLLRSAGLVAIDTNLEQDWSGRGQHVQFRKDEIKIVNQLLVMQDNLGKGNSAVVHSVKCRRITLARKTIYTNRQFTKRQAAQEVAHMTRLNHSHIVRLIGTYIWKTELSILMYPVADYNLNSFLDVLTYATVNQDLWLAMISSCQGFFSCLSSALSYIHSKLTKHMDIKPQNILVRTGWQYVGWHRNEHISKVYISDFGIARSYQNADATETDGLTMFTRKYAAPEVVRQDLRGLSADVFSLGCVFLEIFATLYSIGVETPGRHELANYHLSVSLQVWRTVPHKLSMLGQLQARFAESVDMSYQYNIEVLQELFGQKQRIPVEWMHINRNYLEIILSMIRRAPQHRPTVQQLAQHFPAMACCNAGPDELQEATDDE